MLRMARKSLAMVRSTVVVCKYVWLGAWSAGRCWAQRPDTRAGLLQVLPQVGATGSGTRELGANILILIHALGNIPAPGAKQVATSTSPSVIYGLFLRQPCLTGAASTASKCPQNASMPDPFPQICTLSRTRAHIPRHHGRQVVGYSSSPVALGACGLATLILATLAHLPTPLPFPHPTSGDYSLPSALGVGLSHLLSPLPLVSSSLS